MIVALGLLLNIATIILGCILSVLLKDFRARGPINIPTPIVALTEFFIPDAEINVHPLSASWYLISSLWMNLCSCMHIISMLLSINEPVSTGSWNILFKVLTLNVAICIEFLYFIPDIGLVVRVFASGPGDLGSIPGRVIPKTQKMVLDASLLNTQHYKVRIKGKVEQSRERSRALPYTFV